VVEQEQGGAEQGGHCGNPLDPLALRKSRIRAQRLLGVVTVQLKRDILESQTMEPGAITDEAEAEAGAASDTRSRDALQRAQQPCRLTPPLSLCSAPYSVTRCLRGKMAEWLKAAFSKTASKVKTGCAPGPPKWCRGKVLESASWSCGSGALS